MGSYADLPANIFAILVALLPVALWAAWWLWAVNWKKLGPVLREGAWAPVLLLILVAALVWSRIAPSNLTSLGLVIVPNFWWQLGGVLILALAALFYGWLQGVVGWIPMEVPVAPPADGQGQHDGHAQV